MNVTIKGLPEEVHARVRQRAARSRRSLNAELIVALEEAVGLRDQEQAELWRALDGLVDSLPPVDHARVTEFREGRRGGDSATGRGRPEAGRPEQPAAGRQ